MIRLAVLLLLLAAGCASPPMAIYLAPEAAALAETLRTAQPAVETRTGLRFVVTFDEPTGGEGLAVTALSPVPAAWQALPSVAVTPPDGASFAPAMTRRLAGVPLFWDVAGITAFATELPAGVPDGPRSWDEPARGWPLVKRLSVSGGEPDLRLLAWVGAGAGSEALPTSAQFNAFAAWLGSPLWVTDAWRLTRSDSAVGYAGGKGVAFIETFRDFRQANPTGFRRFFPLAGPTVAASVLTLVPKGGDAVTRAARAWVEVLASVAVQKQFSLKTGWMPANLSAPVLDTASAQARKALLAATVVVPVATVTDAVRERLGAVFPNAAQVSGH